MYLSLAGQRIENTTLKDAVYRLEKIIAQGNLYLYPLLRNGGKKKLSRSHHVLTFEVVPFNKRLLTPKEANETETICIGNVVSIFGDKTPFKLSTNEDKFSFEQLLDIATCLTLAGSNVYIPSPPEQAMYPPPISHYPLVLFDPDQAENAEFVVSLVS